jgi:hypothetical protein
VLKCSRSIPVLYPLRSKNNSALALSTTLHLSAFLETPPQHLFYSNGPQYKVSSCAEPCTTVCAQDSYLTPQSKEQVTMTFLQEAALVCGFSNSAATYPKLGPFVLSSFAACGSVHDCSRAWPALHPLAARIKLVQVSPKQQHKYACLETRLRRLSYPDRPLYQVTSCAELCAIARAQDFYFSPQSEEPSILTLLQNAAPVRVLSDLAATLFIPRLPRKLSFAACKDVHDRSRSQSVPQLFKKNSRSGRDDREEHDALSWEEIPSPACIPPILPCSSNPGPSQYINQTIHSSLRDSPSSYPPGHSFSLPSDDFSIFIPFCSPHTHAITDSMLGTAFFFSWEENWGTQRPFLASQTPPHALAALSTLHQRALYFDRSLHKVTNCAELCTTSCVQYSSPIPLSTAQLPIPFLQNSAYARALNNLSPTLPRGRTLVLPRFATCGSVHDCSRTWPAPYLFRARISSVQVFFRVPRLRADLATQPQLVSRIDCYPYHVTSCAKACTVARAQDCHFFPQQVELLSLSLLQNAALARGFSAFVMTCLRPRQLCLPSYAAHEDMHDCSHAQIVLHLLRVEASTFSLFLSMPHATAHLATRPRSSLQPKRCLYQLLWHTEARTTARTLIIFPIPFPDRLHVPTFPQSTARARDLSNSASPFSRPRRPLLQSYVVRRNVHGHSVPHPLMAKVSSFRLLRALHAAADLATWHRRGPRLGGRLYQISWRAKACLTASVQVWFLIPLSLEQLIASLPPNAAHVRTFSDSVPQHCILGLSLLQDYVARGAVLDRSYPQLSPLLLRVETSSVQASQRTPQSSAALVTWCQRAQGPDGCSYQVVQRARPCLIARVGNHFLVLQIIESLLLTSLQSAAPTRGLSYSTPARRQYRKPLLRTVALREDMCNHLSSQSLYLLLGAEDSALQVSLRAPRALTALAALPQHVPSPDRRLYQVVKRADTCMIARAQDWNLSSSSQEQFSPTSFKSAAPVRGLSFSEPARLQSGRMPSGIFALRGDMRGHSRQFAFTDRKQALRFRVVLLAQLSSGSSLRLERTEDSPDLSWEEMMRRRCGSTREYVQRDDFEPRARRGGAPARQAGGAATRVAQPPQPHNPSNSQHTATTHPRQLLGSAPNSVEISSIGGTMDPQ